MSDEFEKLTPQEELHYLKRNYIASQYRIASVAYALVICLIGVVLITIEPFKACKPRNFYYESNYKFYYYYYYLRYEMRTRCKNIGRFVFHLYVYRINILDRDNARIDRNG